MITSTTFPFTEKLQYKGTLYAVRTYKEIFLCPGSNIMRNMSRGHESKHYRHSLLKIKTWFESVLVHFNAFIIHKTGFHP